MAKTAKMTGSKTEPNIQFNAQLPPEMVRLIGLEAVDQRCTKSEVVRQALQAYFKGKKPGA